MPCRFPGVDPFLEDPAHFAGFHARFVNAWCEALDAQLPDGYFADLGESVYLVEELSQQAQLRYPDVSVSRDPSSPQSSANTPSAATIEPVTIPLVLTGIRPQNYVRILHQPGRELIAVLELLSPTNKENPGRSTYLLKRDELLNQRIHLIELDLLRGGRRMPFERDLPLGDYFAIVARSDQRPNAQVYAWPLPHQLPNIPVPLRAGDTDVFVDMQLVFQTAYERGRYDRKIDYTQPPPISFDEATRIWIAERLKVTSS
jgi:hypothetical protein